MLSTATARIANSVLALALSYKLVYKHFPVINTSHDVIFLTSPSRAPHLERRQGREDWMGCTSSGGRGEGKDSAAA
jgi:hypothetical protein